MRVNPPMVLQPLANQKKIFVAIVDQILADPLALNVTRADACVLPSGV
jgi:hypothetical protein